MGGRNGAWVCEAEGSVSAEKMCPAGSKGPLLTARRNVLLVLEWDGRCRWGGGVRCAKPDGANWEPGCPVGCGVGTAGQKDSKSSCRVQTPPVVASSGIFGGYGRILSRACFTQCTLASERNSGRDLLCLRLGHAVWPYLCTAARRCVWALGPGMGG